jgi:hypothetical protein
MQKVKMLCMKLRPCGKNRIRETEDTQNISALNDQKNEKSLALMYIGTSTFLAESYQCD